MRHSRIRVIVAFLFIAVFLSGIYSAVVFNSNFGTLNVNAVSIEDQGKQLSGLIYMPISASSDNPCPAVVVAHGIGGSKSMMSNLGLELAKKGFIVLCLDLIGHGQSEGTVSQGIDEIDFGVSAATRYLEIQTYVNSSEIGLVGHSLGGGAIRAEAAQNSNVRAIVLIAGGLGTEVQRPGYGVLNATHPKNLLVIVGKYDVLFNITDVKIGELQSAFNTSTPLMPSLTYGNFEMGTARKFVVPLTSHLFEPIDPSVVAEVVAWMERSFTSNRSLVLDSDISVSYLQRESSVLFALIGLLGITLMVYYPLNRLFFKKTFNPILEANSIGKSKVFGVWIFLNLVLFFPMILVGLLISFPPLIFGSSIGWWVLVVGLIGLFLFAKNKPMLWKFNPDLKKLILMSFSKKGVIIAIVLFSIVFTIASLTQTLLLIDLRILAPIFQAFTQLRRVLVFMGFIPFFLVYFLAEGIYLYAFNTPSNSVRKWRVLEWMKVVFIKISPFLLIIAIQYFPKVIIDVWILPSFIGFIAEFLWLIIPIFVITTTCGWWFYEKTGKIGTGVVFNTLLLSWITAVVFPF
jgi:uncharacterized protein